MFSPFGRSASQENNRGFQGAASSLLNAEKNEEQTEGAKAEAGIVSGSAERTDNMAEDEIPF
jgi:hypothetical protein